MFTDFLRNTNFGQVNSQANHRIARKAKGFTLIELMIVIAVIAILLTLALPTYSNYTTRAKIAEGLGVAASAKTSTASACVEDPLLTGLTPSKVGYAPTSAINTAYISTIDIQGDCVAPEIVITTQNTGVSGPEPVITLTGDITVGTGKITWVCESNNTPAYLLPKTCRS